MGPRSRSVLFLGALFWSVLTARRAWPQPEAPPPQTLNQIPRGEQPESTRHGAAHQGVKATSTTDAPKVYDFKLSAGPFYGKFSGGYGAWYGSHLRLWLLDVTGKRGYSGFLEVVNTRWSADADPRFERPPSASADFAMGRILRYWNDSFYTFLTLGGTLGDTIFPGVQADVEANYRLPSLKPLVISIGGGYRGYDAVRRPFLSTGLSYSFPAAAFLYRMYTGAGLARQASVTSLFTFVYGARLKQWVRLDFLWGAEDAPSGRLSVGDSTIQADSRAVALTWERWILDGFGFVARFGVTESTVTLDDEQRDFHRFEGELRLFTTF
jgi:YaiO family outer membrane protein